MTIHAKKSKKKSQQMTEKMQDSAWFKASIFEHFNKLRLLLQQLMLAMEIFVSKAFRKQFWEKSNIANEEYQLSESIIKDFFHKKCTALKTLDNAVDQVGYCFMFFDHH